MSLLPVLDKCPDCAGRGWTAETGEKGWCARCDGRGITLIQKTEACPAYSPLPDEGSFQCELPSAHDGDHRVEITWHG